MLEAHAPIEIFPEIDSTLLEARRRAERGAYGPVWLLARRQNAGIGRRGRSWTSIEGNVMATYLGLTRQAPPVIALMGFAAGVAIAETVEDMIGEGRAALKWPNDLFIDGAKAAGLMLDCGAAPGGQHWIALSFGVNLIGSPDALDQPTASVRSALPPDAVAPTPELFMARLRPRLEARAEILERDGFGALRTDWRRRAHRLGQEISVQSGAETLTGRFAGISERGELELDTQSGRRLISAGDVLLAAPARV